MYIIHVQNIEWKPLAGFLVFVLAYGTWAPAQRISGELRLQVADASGAALPASCKLVGLATGVERTFQTDGAGRYTARALPFGRYRLLVEQSGFAPHAAIIEIQSQTPLEYPVTLRVAPLETTVEVRDSETLLDPVRTAETQYLSPQELRDRPSAAPGRAVLDLVNRQPGWLLEANGVLHPRGSEYDVQYVVDGIPLYDNRSPAFAQSLGIEEFQSMSVRTGGYPAEFGRKLGGVIEIATERDTRPGLHGNMILQGGSFAQRTGYASARYTHGKTSVGASGEGMMTDRYLDPPVEQNYTNRASGGAFSVRFERDWSGSDRTRVYVSGRHTGFQVPNELLQQAAGQRQDRTAAETLGQVSHTHVVSPRVLAQFRLMARDTSARLWSNALSTPILPAQQRGFREVYLGGSLSAHTGRHELKAGSEALFSSIHEDFAFRIAAYRIHDLRIFDGDIPQDFRFVQRRNGRDQSVFAQDLWRLGKLTLSGGLRFDHYRLAQDETAWSPRLGAAYHIPSAGLVLRASYDRVFQVPATENLLLASSDLVPSLGGEGAFLLPRPARGNFLGAGFSKSVLRRLRVDGAWFRRRLHNFADDSLLLNTGVSFPIAFAKAEIHGYEAKIEIPSWGPFSGFVSFTNLLGLGRLPVAGGLFLGDEVEELLEGKGSFPISQDQRNTVRWGLRWQPHPRVWFAWGGSYNSGLPFEIEGPTNRDFIARQYGPRTLSQINFERGRVRPSSSLDLSMGLEVFRSERAQVRLQADVFNVTDRFNVINFSGVFSGTALSAPRNVAVRLQTEF